MVFVLLLVCCCDEFVLVCGCRLCGCVWLASCGLLDIDVLLLELRVFVCVCVGVCVCVVVLCCAMYVCVFGWFGIGVFRLCFRL